MRKLVSILTLLVLWPPSQSPAQLYPPNEAGVSLSAWHTIVRDVEATKKFWALFCGTPMKIEGIEVMKIPGVLVFLHPGEPSGPSAGAVIDHVGFSCQNCYALVKRLVDAGVKTDRLNPETMRNPNWKPGGEPSRAWTYAYTPDGLKIEIKTSPCTLGSIYAAFAPRDPSVPCPERMAGAVPTSDRAGAMGSDQLHFHLNSDIDVKGIYNFYTQFFGGKLVRYSNLNVVIPGTIMLLVTSAQPRPFNKGRALDSIGFEVRNLEQFSKKLEAAGMKFDQPYSKTRYQSFAHAAFTDPWGTPVQLTEGLGRLAPAAPPKGRGSLRVALQRASKFSTSTALIATAPPRMMCSMPTHLG